MTACPFGGGGGGRLWLDGCLGIELKSGSVAKAEALATIRREGGGESLYHTSLKCIHVFSPKSGRIASLSF